MSYTDCGPNKPSALVRMAIAGRLREQRRSTSSASSLGEVSWLLVGFLRPRPQEGTGPRVAVTAGCSSNAEVPDAAVW